jgi:hypothetical protein
MHLARLECTPEFVSNAALGLNWALGMRFEAVSQLHDVLSAFGLMRLAL